VARRVDEHDEVAGCHVAERGGEHDGIGPIPGCKLDRTPGQTRRLQVGVCGGELDVPEAVDGQDLGLEDAGADVHARRRKAGEVVDGERRPERTQRHADRQVRSHRCEDVAPVERVGGAGQVVGRIGRLDRRRDTAERIGGPREQPIVRPDQDRRTRRQRKPPP
jgi:hypothetical protein